MNPINNETTQIKREQTTAHKGQPPLNHEPCILKTWLARRQWLLKPILHR